MTGMPKKPVKKASKIYRKKVEKVSSLLPKSVFWWKKFLLCLFFWLDFSGKIIFFNTKPFDKRKIYFLDDLTGNYYYIIRGKNHVSKSTFWVKIFMNVWKRRIFIFSCSIYRLGKNFFFGLKKKTREDN